MILNRIFYSLKPAIPRRLQIYLRRRVAAYKRKKYSHIWPINPNAGNPPEGWQGWPDGKEFALVLSHDVDSRKGFENCLKLAKLEERMGFRSSFNFVPELYGRVSPSLLEGLRKRGFDVAVHGLKHDGKLFRSRHIFNRRADKINAYLKKWRTRGFTSPSMHHNLYWLAALDIDYSLSTFDTDPFEPQPDAVETIFPFWVSNRSPNKGFVELPYTLPQDSTLFIILQEKDIKVWKQKLKWLVKNGGMVLLNTHPDYMDFDGSGDLLTYPIKHYIHFLLHIKKNHSSKYFHSLPEKIATFYKKSYLNIGSNISIKHHQVNQLNFITKEKFNYRNNLEIEDARELYSGALTDPAKPKSAADNKKNHILFIVENNTVPTDIRVWREANTAKKCGFRVSVISPKGNKLKKKFEVIDDIEIYRHPSIKPKKGIRYQILEYVNAFFWETLLSCKIFIRRPFHVLHVANPPDNLFLLGLIFKIFGVKIIFDHHDLAPELFLSKFKEKKGTVFKLLKILEKCSCRCADLVITTNESYKEHIIESHKIRDDKIFIVRNDPEIPTASRRNNNKSKGDKATVDLFYVGSINTQDGVELLVEAVNILVNEFDKKNVRCTVIGDGEQFLYIKNRCNELGLYHYFDFKGYIHDRVALSNYIDTSDICLEPAPGSEVNNKSTFIKIMEYMAAGKPIVAFDLDETRYSVNGCAILVEPGNIFLFARAIKMLIDEPSIRLYMGRKAQSRIIEKLNWPESSKMLEKAYSRVAK
jgi:glycosyltransferase involved in cell wall biosynthesis